MLIADRLAVPDGTTALLWDMDGVLLDTLSMDYLLVNQLLNSYLTPPREVPRKVVRAYFPYAIPDFWRLVLEDIGINLPSDAVDTLVREHRKARKSTSAAVSQGVTEILEDAAAGGLPAAVVSNNPEADIERMLTMAGLRKYFNVIVGNDNPEVRKKPAPDSYLEAARRLGAPGQCAAVEDSILGAAAAKAAGCWTVGVATGASDFQTLSSSPYVDLCYATFAPCRVVLGREGVTKKSLITPNEFVSHMIEHIAWRLGCSIDVYWTSDDWRQLGAEMGQRITQLCSLRGSAGALGMIDDGSCEVALRCNGTGGMALRASAQVDLDWFLALRCEQLANGQPLLDMLQGLGTGCGVEIDVLVASVEDPHHAWEGIFRGVGIGLNKLSGTRERMKLTPAAKPPIPPGPSASATQTESVVERGWTVTYSSATRARLHRQTAESSVDIDVVMETPPGAECQLSVSDSIDVNGITDLLRAFAEAGGMRLVIGFNATRLSSSHVVTEDIGLALGRAIRCIAVERMTAFGINGAGSSIDSSDDLSGQAIRVGVSMEGRKFWKFVPFSSDYPDFRKSFLVGHTLPNGLYTEDLDDFIDGFAGGLQASVMVHVASRPDPAAGWPLVFRGLGAALAELLAENPDRQALTPGVKATLA